MSWALRVKLAEPAPFWVLSLIVALESVSAEGRLDWSALLCASVRAVNPVPPSVKPVLAVAVWVSDRSTSVKASVAVAWSTVERFVPARSVIAPVPAASTGWSLVPVTVITTDCVAVPPVCWSDTVTA
ncbi:hypothetical protein AFCDBAGC_2651 [Methylobacterium cerastii]|uniref:Secreted protein n=1 Tax=Methylobacterium cerastii TaxID=932741 RepID=A0ABQ4QIA0_9HYPH|nr:hypothetical protein AFCDBAGC_2651 [Methylobacterium cerastii]